jgi:hypothetical protein
MNIETYSRTVALADASEIQKVALLAYFFTATKDQQEFHPREMAEMLAALGYARPNVSRLASRLRNSRDFIKGSKAGLFRLSVGAKGKLSSTFPDIGSSEEISSDSTLIPEILFDSLKRPYLTRTVQQVNAAFESNLFDACTLMMRRLLEILMIHAFQKAGLEAAILDSDGGFQNLKTLINKALSRPEIGLSSTVRTSIDQFRELGNLSAHHMHYNCRRDDIRSLRMEYRAVIEELLYKAGLKT